MNNYEEWSKLVAKRLKVEADIITALDKDELEDNAAKEAFIRNVLEPFLPENYAIGSGRIVDSHGTYSDHVDIVIYNRDFPRIDLRGAQPAYLFESVFATVIVKAKLVKKSVFDALDCSASIAALDANIDKRILHNLAKLNGMKMIAARKYTHEDPMRSERFKLIGRPPTFVYGFTGIKNSHRQLKESLQSWFEHRAEAGSLVEMQHLPAVIAAQGCFAWRNAAPLILSNSEMFGLGADSAPVRLIILQLLHLINRRLNVKADGYGLKPNLKSYLRHFSAPVFEEGLGEVSAAQKSLPATTPKAPVNNNPAIAAAAVDEASESEPTSASSAEEGPGEDSAAQQSLPTSAPESLEEAIAATAAEAASEPVPSSDASALESPTPLPPVDIDFSSDGAEATAGNAENSANQASSDDQAEQPEPVAAVDSAANSAAEPDEIIEATSDSASETSTDDDENKSKKSTDAFIARVKQQMSGTEPFPQLESEAEPEHDPFTSTIPQ